MPALFTAAEQDLQLDTRQMFRRVQAVPALAEAYQLYHQTGAAGAGVVAAAAVVRACGQTGGGVGG